MEDTASHAEPVAAQEQAVDGAKEPSNAPASTATGNAHIAIFKHELIDAVFDSQDSRRNSPAGIELAIGNVSDTAIATALFEAVFRDNAGNVLDRVKHKEVDLPPNTSRSIVINSLQYELGVVKSYAVRLIRTSRADIEKVQLRRQDIRTAETGEETIHGIVKNISEDKTDAAVVVSFYDAGREILGTRVVLLRGIEPGAICQYDVRFKPQDGETVAGCGFAIGELIE